MQMNDTILQDPCYRCKVTNYPNGHAELVFWYDEPLRRAERRESQLYPLVRTKSEPSEIIDPDAETNAERAARRAKSKVRKLIMTMQADRMLTLTFRDNLTELDTASKLFVRFIKLVHKSYPNYKYVMVAERQKRGAWHFHLAVRGFQDVGFLRAQWRSLADGNIDVTNPRVRGDKSLSSPMIAGYLTKYLSKQFAESHEFNRYRYRASNGIELQQHSFWLNSQSWSEVQKEAGNLISQTYGQIGAYFFSDDWNSGWFASWSFSSRKSAFKAKPTTS